MTKKELIDLIENEISNSTDILQYCRDFLKNCTNDEGTLRLMAEFAESGERNRLQAYNKCLDYVKMYYD